MIVVDASAIISILFEEPEADVCMRALEADSTRLITAVNYVEAGTVLAGRIVSGRPEDAMDDLDAFIEMFGIRIAPINEPLARAALRARVHYGKGFGTRRGLNFGDCFAYALAKQHDCPLLYVGDDFAVTDIRSATAG